MHIPIFVLAIVAFIGFVFITPYREGIVSLFRTIWNLLCGFLSGVAPAAAPATATALRRIIATVLFLVIIFLLFVLFVYFLAALSIMAVGNATGNWYAASIFLLTILVWGIFSATPSMLIFRPLRWISSWIVRPIAVILALYLLWGAAWHVFGNVSPQLAKSAGRSGNATVEQFANDLDKKSIQSEREAGTFAKASADTKVYNRNRQPFSSLKKGDLVYVLDKQGASKTNDHEGLIWIMLPNQDGEFVGGQRGFIPSRLIDWEWKSTQATRKESHNFTLYDRVSEEATLLSGTWKVSGEWHLVEYRLIKWNPGDFRPLTDKLVIDKESGVYFRNREWSGGKKVVSNITISN